MKRISFLLLFASSHYAIVCHRLSNDGLSSKCNSGPRQTESESKTDYDVSYGNNFRVFFFGKRSMEREKFRCTPRVSHFKINKTQLGARQLMPKRCGRISGRKKIFFFCLNVHRDNEPGRSPFCFRKIFRSFIDLLPNFSSAPSSPQIKRKLIGNLVSVVYRQHLRFWFFLLPSI